MSQIPFGQYADKILQFANETFAPMYHKIHKQYWHDQKFFAKMTQNYTSTDWQNAQFETYIPTEDIPGYGLSYYRIAIKLLPAVNNQTFREETEKLRAPLHMPPGQLDSELQIIISPRLNKWGFIRAYRHRKDKKGYLSTIYITNKQNKKTFKTDVTPPEVLWVRILRGISEFLNKRITALLDKLNLNHIQRDSKDNNTCYYILSNSNTLSRFSHSIRTTILSLSHCLDYFLHKIWGIKTEIGIQNKALSCTVEQMREEISYLQKAIKQSIIIQNNIELNKGLEYLEALRRR